MPPAPVDRARLTALGTALQSWQECAHEGADDVLAHLVEVGDAEAQRALDDYLDAVAELLRAVEAAAGDLAATLRVVAGGDLATGAAPLVGPRSVLR
jgi:hypothetical protein